MARPRANVLAVLFQILEIQEVTTPRVALAQPRVELGICLLLLSLSAAVNSHRARLMLGEQGPVPELCVCYFLCLDVDGGSASWPILLYSILYWFLLSFFLLLLFF
ncbi:hypothetical protein Hanom_Chr01g00031301 [Helianthus anomalus]